MPTASISPGRRLKGKPADVSRSGEPATEAPPGGGGAALRGHLGADAGQRVLDLDLRQPE